MDIYKLDNEGGNNGSAAALLTGAALAGGGGGGLLGGNSGLGGGILGFLLGMIFPRLFGQGGLFGNNYGGGVPGAGNGAGTAYLGTMISNDNGRDLIMQAITNQGDRQHDAVVQLSSALNADFNTVNSGIQAISAAIGQLANSQGLSSLQIINALQSGNATLGSQFSQCCCQMQNQVAQGFAGVNASIAAKSAADQLAMCQQTYQLTDVATRNNQAVLAKLDAIEDARKDREIAALTSENASLKSQNFIAAAIGQAVAPLQAQLGGLRADVDSVKCKLPDTVTVPNSQWAVVPSWAAGIGTDFLASLWANRLTQATAGGTTGGTATTGAAAA